MDVQLQPLVLLGIGGESTSSSNLLYPLGKTSFAEMMISITNCFLFLYLLQMSALSIVRKRCSMSSFDVDVIQ